MVKRLFKIFGREIGGLHEAAYLLGAFALLSQVLALVRDRLLAFQFGASHSLDIYYAAFRIPDFIFVSVASMISLSVMIPFLMERLDKGEGEAKEFIDAVFSFFFLVIGGVALLAFIFAPFIVRLLFPEFGADVPTLVTMTRIMLLSPLLLGFSNFLASVTQIYKRFFIYALSPIAYNVGIIVGIMVLVPSMGVVGLAWGVALGAFLHCFLQVPFVWHKSLFPRLTWRINMEPIRRVVLVSLPRTLTLSSNEIAEFFLVVLAGALTGGAISVFNFAWNLQSVPLSVVGVSYSLAAFPVLTRLISSGQRDKFLEQMIASARHIVFWSVPIIAIFVVLRAQIVRVILGSGHFNWSDTRLTAAALALFTLSLVPQGLTTLFVRAYYSRGDTKKPLLMNAISAALIVGASFALVRVWNAWEPFRAFIEAMFRVEDVPGTVVLMLPLGFSIGSGLNMILHWIAFERDFRGFTSSVRATAVQTVVAALAMGFVSYEALAFLGAYLDLGTFTGIFLQGLAAGFAGIVAFVVVLWLFGSKELSDVANTLRHKIWRAKVVPPDAVPGA